MPTQEVGGIYYDLYRHWRDKRVLYWANIQQCDNLDGMVSIRATQNALHPEWDEVPLEYTVDGGVMDYEAFMSLYERVEE